MVVFQSENHFYFLCKSIEQNTPVVQLYRSTKNEDMELLESKPLNSSNQRVYLRIEPKKDRYLMSWAVDEKIWNPILEVDARFLSTETAGGFVGCVIGLYATSL